MDGWLEGQSKESVSRHVRQDNLKILHQIIHTENSPTAPRPPTILKDQAKDLLPWLLPKTYQPNWPTGHLLSPFLIPFGRLKEINCTYRPSGTSRFPKCHHSLRVIYQTLWCPIRLLHWWFCSSRRCRRNGGNIVIPWWLNEIFAWVGGNQRESRNLRDGILENISNGKSSFSQTYIFDCFSRPTNLLWNSIQGGGAAPTKHFFRNAQAAVFEPKLSKLIFIIIYFDQLDYI